jgi:hypothetical protein
VSDDWLGPLRDRPALDHFDPVMRRAALDIASRDALDDMRAAADKMKAVGDEAERIGGAYKALRDGNGGRLGELEDELKQARCVFDESRARFYEAHRQRGE